MNFHELIKDFTSLELSDPIFKSYETARNILLPQVLESRKLGRSNYWNREILSINYLMDANSLILSRLREHCHWITGVHPYQYSSHHQFRPEKSNMENRINELRMRNSNLSIFPERSNYGGFGFQIGKYLYNVDTLKFHEVMIGLHENVTGFQGENNKKIVLEIGSGFGGLADTLRNKYKDAKIILVDLPEILIIAATFLGAWYPDLKIKFLKSEIEITRVSPEDFDVLIVPNHLLRNQNRFTFNIDLLINTVSFQEMTSAEVSSYVNFAFNSKIPYIYSLNRDVSTYNSELDSVRNRIGEHYRLVEIEILEDSYTSALKAKKKPRNKMKFNSIKSDNPYRHILGRIN